MKAQETLRLVQKRIVDLVFQDTDSGQRRPDLAAYFLRFFMHLGRGVTRHQCFQRASALAYTTVLSVVPICALFVIYFKMAGKLDTLSGNVQAWILRSLVAESAQGIAVYIDQFVANLHTKVLGTVGVGGMFFVAYSTLRTVEHSFNAIWNVHKGRSFWARFQMLSSLLVVVPTLLFASMYVTGRMNGLKLFDRYHDITGFMQTVFWTAPFLLTALPLFILYKLVPNTSVKWKPALLAALIAAVLFETAKGGFNLYVLKVVKASTIYGSLGLIPVFLLWIYFSWIIVLLGVELSHTIQNLNTIHREAMEERYGSSGLYVHEDWGLKIFEALGQRFSKVGGPVDPATLFGEIRLPLNAIEDHLEVLRSEGFLLWVEDEDHKGYVPAKPLEQLSPLLILNAFRMRIGLPKRSA